MAHVTGSPARRGFTLIEMVMVMALIGILMAVAIPRFRGTQGKNDVRSALDVVAAMHGVAKTAAIQRGRTASVVFDAGTARLWVVVRTATGTAVDTVGRIENLASRFGVTLAVSTDTLKFSPRGIGMNAAGSSFIVSKAGFTDTIQVSVTGRLAR